MSNYQKYSDKLSIIYMKEGCINIEMKKNN